mgnify:CR=1 FL=1
MTYNENYYKNQNREQREVIEQQEENIKALHKENHEVKQSIYNELIVARNIGKSNDMYKNIKMLDIIEKLIDDLYFDIQEELNEELELAEKDLSHLELRYVTLRRCNGEIRQNYYFFADLKDEVDVNFHSSEGISRWFDLSELNSLEMPFTSKYVVKHYLEIGCKNHDIYAGIADGEKIVFVNMPEF